MSDATSPTTPTEDTDLMVAGVLDRGSEFFRTIANGPESSRIYGACGPRAFTSVLCAVLNMRILALTVFWLMKNAGLCDGEGVTTLAKLQASVGHWKGAVSDGWHNYDEVWHLNSWRADMVARAKARNPFVLMLHAGQQLHDLISGLGENADNLENHFIAVLGYHPGGYSARANKDLPEGVWCADGANYAGGNNRNTGFNAADVLQFYSLDNLQAAWPVGFVGLQGYVAPTPSPEPPSPTPTPSPTPAPEPVPTGTLVVIFDGKQIAKVTGVVTA